MLLRIADTTRRELDSGTPIPVVRESMLGAARALQFLDVPVKSSTRTLLRVYDVRFKPGDEATVRFFSDATQTPIVEKTIRFQFAIPPAETPFAAAPGYFSISLDELIVAGRVRVEVQVQESIKVWAMISITENETNHVVIRSPD